MKILLIIVVVCSQLLLLPGCAGPGKDKDPSKSDDPSNPAALSLLDTYWKLTELNGKKVSEYPLQNKEPFILLHKVNNRADATGGCNGMGGTYELKNGNHISLSQLISTKMACPDMTLETDFQNALTMADTYEITGKELKLTKGDTGLSIRFEASKK